MQLEKMLGMALAMVLARVSGLWSDSQWDLALAMWLATEWVMVLVRVLVTRLGRM